MGFDWEYCLGNAAEWYNDNERRRDLDIILSQNGCFHSFCLYSRITMYSNTDISMESGIITRAGNFARLCGGGSREIMKSRHTIATCENAWIALTSERLKVIEGKWIQTLKKSWRGAIVFSKDKDISLGVSNAQSACDGYNTWWTTSRVTFLPQSKHTYYINLGSLHFSFVEIGFPVDVIIVSEMFPTLLLQSLLAHFIQT
jgi:hypothetical protein